MKKLIANILIVTILTLGVGGALAVPRTAHAACSIGEVVVGNGITDCVNEVVVVTVMPIVGKFLQLSAYLFDHAITLNLNIAQFLQTCTEKDCKTSPIEVVWKLIRDISGMFFIFVLVWASILMILRGESSKGAIIGVIMAGLLVNFSLFATKVIIDASNSLTLTVYSAISPNYNPTILSSLGFGPTDVNRQTPGSVSSKIMQVVDIQSLYASTKDATKKTNFNVNSIVATVGGISLMLVLGIAFLASGVMFLWRFIMLLGLMAFSPIPALAFAFPGLKGYSNTFGKKLMDQCLFAPVFLFFLYIALKVMTDPAFIALSNPNKSTFAGVFGQGAIAPLIQYGLVIFIIFMGLVTAKSFGAKGADWGMGTITGLGKWTGGIVGRNTVGRVAKDVGSAVDWASAKQLGDPNGKFAGFAKTGNFLAKVTGASSMGKEGVKAARSGLKGVAGSKFGSNQSLDDVKKEDKEYAKKQQEINRENTLAVDINTHLNATTDTSHGELKKVLSKLSGKDVEKLDKDIYKPKLAAQLSSSQVSSILKSDELTESDKDKFKKARTEGIVARATNFKYSDIENILKEDLSDEQKDGIKKARTDTLEAALAAGNDGAVKDMMKNISGKEIAKMFEKVPYTPGGVHPLLAKHLKISHLEDMKGIDRQWRKEIGDTIYDWDGGTGVNVHDAKGYVDSNAQRGTWRT